MKKTRETLWRGFPSEAQTNEISGCREFQGQDLRYDARKQYQKNVQKQWLDEQIEEKRRRQEQEKMEEQAYASQTHELNRMRGMLEDNFQNTKTSILGDVTEFNKMLDLQRKQREEAEKQAKLNYQREEVDYLKQRGVKQNFP